MGNHLRKQKRLPIKMREKVETLLLQEKGRTLCDLQHKAVEQDREVHHVQEYVLQLKAEGNLHASISTPVSFPKAEATVEAQDVPDVTRTVPNSQQPDPAYQPDYSFPVLSLPASTSVPKMIQAVNIDFET